MSIYPTKEEFIKLAKKGNLIPVYKEILADLETPVSAFLKIKKNSSYSFLLESVEGQEKIARYSFLGSEPKLVLRCKADRFEVLEPILGKDKSISFRPTRLMRTKNPLIQIKEIMSAYKLVQTKNLPRFCGGLVGFFGYDVVRCFENIPDKNFDETGIYDAIFILVDTLVIFDHVNHMIKIVANTFLGDARLDNKALGLKYNQAIQAINKLESKLNSSLKKSDLKSSPKSKLVLGLSMTKAEFCRIVKKAKRYIREGDIIQVVLSQRFKIKTRKKPFDAYRNLRSLNPSAYMYYLEFDSVCLVGSSPELLVRCEDSLVATRPIAGTRPRGKDETQDKRFEEELLSDIKEKAEHLMLVDLGRNDLGRVCEYGTVKLTDFMKIEKYSHVMHLVSNVQGKLKKGRTAYDVMAATFPAGTVSGSPKIRAMEIIDELENTRRGPYAGAVGYFSFSGNLDTAITIRTIVFKDGVAYIQAGAGIVADSVPEREYTETLNKAKAQIEALKN